MIRHERVQMSFPMLFHPVEIIDGLPCYCVYHPDLPGCMSDGETPEEAVANLDAVREYFIEVLKRRGCEIPEPPYADVYYQWVGEAS